EGHPTETDPHIRRVACQAPTAVTGGFVFQLKAQGQHEGEDQFHKGLAVAKELKVGRFILEIHGDGPVCAGLAGCASHGSPSGQMVGVADDPRWGQDCTIARGSRRGSGLYHEIRWNVSWSTPRNFVIRSRVRWRVWRRSRSVISSSMRSWAWASTRAHGSGVSALRMSSSDCAMRATPSLVYTGVYHLA